MPGFLDVIQFQSLDVANFVVVQLNKQKVLGCFGQSGLQRKEIPTAISMQLFGMVFLCFQGQKIIQTSFKI